MCTCPGRFAGLEADARGSFFTTVSRSLRVTLEVVGMVAEGEGGGFEKAVAKNGGGTGHGHLVGSLHSRERPLCRCIWFSLFAVVESYK